LIPSGDEETSPAAASSATAAASSATAAVTFEVDTTMHPVAHDVEASPSVSAVNVNSVNMLSPNEIIVEEVYEIFQLYLF
jgi:hypothetical protein